MRRHVASSSNDVAGADPLEILAILCLVAWLLGVLSGYTGDGAIHLLVALAALAVIVRIVQTRRGD